MSIFTSLRPCLRLARQHRMQSSFQDICIPVPWGVISGKAWGNQDGRRVLGLHGWLHNANTFDRLAPLLPKDIYLVCIDFPGHGRSSHKPLGGVYGGMERVVDIERVIQHLGWEKFSILGHSLGGIYGAFYAGLFPDKVLKLVLIDTMGPATFTPEQMYNELSSRIPKVNKTYKPPRIHPDTESAAMRMVEEDPDLNLDSARILVKRGIRHVEGGVNFSIDYRLQTQSINVFQLTNEHLQFIYGKIKCSVLIILGLKSRYLSLFQGLEKERISYLKNSPQIEIIGVDGNHNLHLNEPDVVVSHINSFLNSCVKGHVKSML